MRDLSEEALASARETIDETLAEQVAKGRYDEGKARFLSSLVSTSTDVRRLRRLRPRARGGLRGARGQAAGLRGARGASSSRSACSRRTPRASPVAEMGADVGMHFFNPVAVLPLVELVRTPETDDEALATAWAFAEKLRKRPVLVADAPGFVVNRVLTRLMIVVLDAIEHGTTVDEADEAILRLGLPMAPSVLLQMVGPRVANHVLGTLHEAYPDRFPLSQTLANYADGRDEVAVQDAPRPQRRRDPRGRARGARGRDPATCSRRASSPMRGTSTRRCCSARAGRSGSAESPSTSTRSAFRRGCSGARSPRSERERRCDDRRLANPDRVPRERPRRDPPRTARRRPRLRRGEAVGGGARGPPARRLPRRGHGLRLRRLVAAGRAGAADRRGGARRTRGSRRRS